MQQQLEPSHQEELAERCRLIKAADRDHAFALPATELLAPDVCKQLLNRLTPVIGSPNEYVTASLLAKRIAFLTTGSALYAMSVMDRGLNLTIDNSFVEYRHQNGLWQSRMPLDSLNVSIPELNQRAAWRDQLVHNLFAGHLAPLWRSFRAVARVPLPVLWENTAVRVYALYERRLAEQTCPDLRKRIAEDFHYLVHQAPAKLFGADHNPLQRYFPPHPRVPDADVRIRKTCCYYYRATQRVKYCSTCPLPHLKAES